MTTLKTKPARARAGSRTHHAGRRRALPAFWVILIAAGVLLAGTALLLGGGSERDGLVVSDVEILGDTLPPYDRKGTDPAVGMVAPEVYGSSFEGTAGSIGRDGHAKAIVFLAHWCSHCRDEVPAIQGWLSAGGTIPRGVDLVTVSTFVDERRENYPPDAWLEREGWTAPVLVDDAAASVATAFGLDGTPYWVFLDTQGRVVLRASGEIGPAALEQVLVTL
jgi:thiol-disulfide isomerase/thioredoxin